MAFGDKFWDKAFKLGENLADTGLKTGNRLGNISSAMGEWLASLGEAQARAILKWAGLESRRKHIPVDTVLRVTKRDKGRCSLTNKQVPANWLEVDHIRPYIRTEDNSIDNLQLLCGHHNKQKLAKNWHEFKMWYRKNPSSCGPG